ncbi:MAG: zinc ABC transporter substrate-binding protein [Rhodobacteraceae bacterium]|nr:zinc ABC transporter substrate-binding protein [Paracoccaceae bacterium]
MITWALASFLLPLPAMAAVPQVVADLPPIGALAAQVMGDLGKPQVLLGAGASEHDLQLRPSQAAALARADLVVWVGPELSPALGRALEGVDPSHVMTLLQRPETHTAPFTAKWEIDVPGVTEDDPDEHAPGHPDPHVWLDPENGKIWLGLIAEALAAQDGEHAAIYRANAQAAQAGIDAAVAQVRQELAPAMGHPIILFHDGYGYFARYFGLNVAGTVALGDATAPGAARLAALRGAVASARADCLFPEANHSPALIDNLAQGTGVAIGPVLDPVGSKLPQGPGLYTATLLALGQGIGSCFPR